VPFGDCQRAPVSRFGRIEVAGPVAFAAEPVESFDLVVVPQRRLDGQPSSSSVSLWFARFNPAIAFAAGTNDALITTSVKMNR
jgi:hypothetical protein